jgi:nitrile hydratase
MNESAPDHLHDHSHDPASDHPEPGSDYDMLQRAVIELLEEKGILTAAALMAAIEDMDERRPDAGARIVARAWVDAEFKQSALTNLRTAAATLGIDANSAPEFVLLENTETVHHLVVCTLCSCYPRAILGRPPAWYKSREYRSRVVRDPRGVLAEFGTVLPPEVEVRVADSTADCRYLVLPRRPASTDGWTEEQLRSLVTRDSMIGVAPARSASSN